MVDIDLIPQEYRDWLGRRAILRNYALTFFVLLVATVMCGVSFGRAAERAEAHKDQLSREHAFTQQQQAELQLAEQEKGELEQQWSLLRGLRAGANVEDVFGIIERSLPDDDLWFVDWNFRRAGVVAEGQTRSVETGYFIVVPANEEIAADAAWKVETHMTIQGRARDHQALSTFVRALFEQQGIKDVNVKRTSTTRSQTERFVEFDLTVILNSEFKES